VRGPVVVRRVGNAIEISGGGLTPPDPDILAWITPLLEYEHTRHLRGRESYDNDGGRRYVEVETRRLYEFDAKGRLVCSAGFWPLICRTLARRGVSPRYMDVTPENERKTLIPDWEHVEKNFEFRPTQLECLEAVANGPGVIEAPPGYGKTYLYDAIGKLYRKYRIAIVVKRIPIINTIYDRLVQSFAGVGVVHGGRKEYGRITIYSAASLNHYDGRADVMLAEEAHELLADSYVEQLVALFPNTFNWAFTANTTGRSDNTDIRMRAVFGDTIFCLTYPEAQHHGIVLPIKVIWRSVRCNPNPCAGLSDVPKMRAGIWRNDVRNALIAKDAYSYGDDEQTLVMVDKIEHAVYLRQHLKDYTLCFGKPDPEMAAKYIKAGMLSRQEANMTPKYRDGLRQAFEERRELKVIANGVWSTGVSFDSLAVLIRGDAGGSEIGDTQIPGRVSRVHEASGKTFGIVRDYDDKFDIGLERRAAGRRKNYAKKKWTQESADIYHPLFD
jgi:superfamily II DNA or RNA helicase